MLYARIPLERIGVLIGPSGRTKAAIADVTGITVSVDSSTGDVMIDESLSKDPTYALKVRDLVIAIGRGFSEEKAMMLLDEDTYLQVLDIKEYAGRSKARLAQIKARVIGTRGKTRRIVEELTGVDVSVYGHTVSIIGDSIQLPIARQAIEMLLRGSEHAAAYRFLERKRAELKIAEMGL